MKKYIVTSKHPAYKEDLEIINNILIGSNTKDWDEITPGHCERWLKKGWIKKHKKIQFDKGDMLGFASECTDIGKTKPVNYLDELDKFMENKILRNNIKTPFGKHKDYLEGSGLMNG